MRCSSSKAFRSLRIHLTAPPAAELGRTLLQRLALLEILKVSVARRCNVGAAEQIFGAAPLVRVQYIDRQGAKLGMLNAKHLQKLLYPHSGW
mmetsp:Transcript_41626/g.81335  ORF Transcript_41626/g.81335 Transcript_41626/m.81335 type:complete len:92 (+) Transcript_41626:365-640(+)